MITAGNRRRISLTVSAINLVSGGLVVIELWPAATARSNVVSTTHRRSRRGRVLSTPPDQRHLKRRLPYQRAEPSGCWLVSSARESLCAAASTAVDRYVVANVIGVGETTCTTAPSHPYGSIRGARSPCGSRAAHPCQRMARTTSWKCSAGARTNSPAFAAAANAVTSPPMQRFSPLPWIRTAPTGSLILSEPSRAGLPAAGRWRCLSRADSARS